MKRQKKGLGIHREIMAGPDSPARNYRLTYGYACDECGFITNPGKFEGQMFYLPYLWEKSLEFCTQHSDGSVSVEILPEDRELFPEIFNYSKTIRMQESDDGFVREV
jgi:hypothetical protein